MGLSNGVNMIQKNLLSRQNSIKNFLFVMAAFLIQLLGIVFLTSSPLRSEVVGKPVAVVNNEPIFINELEKEAEPFVERFKKTAPEKNQTKEKIADLRKEILNRLIEERLLLQEAKNKKVRVTKVEIERGIDQFKEPFSIDAQGKARSPSHVEKAFQEQLVNEGMTQEQFNKRVEEQLMKLKLIEMEVKSKVEMPAEEEVKKFFDKIKKKIAGQSVESAGVNEDADLNQLSKYFERMMGEQVRIRHILIRSSKNDPDSARQEAKKRLGEIVQKLKAGEDFAFLAKKFSEDPISKERGGDLGFIAKGDIGLPEIDEAISKMKEGEISGIIETEIGVHVVKLIEKKAPHPLEYEDISEDLKNYIAQKNFTKKLEKYIKDLRAKANIKINPIE